MKIQFHNNLQSPQTLTVTRVVVLDQNDNPLAVAFEADPGVIIIETANGDELAFNNVLRNLGIAQTLLIHEAKQRELPEIKIPGLG